ncbi:MAG: primosomal protein N' [Gammaproteobacteria bacterium]|nr:primosomal protein N' [Gammaproteobacteria bacterium]
MASIESRGIVLRVAVNVPLMRCFDYLPPADAASASRLVPGIRVRVPFGHSTRVGILVGLGDAGSTTVDRLKAVNEVLDETPVLEGEMFALLNWASAYYHHPLGEVMMTALPVLLRQGEPAVVAPVPYVRIPPDRAADDAATLDRAPRQRALVRYLRGHPEGIAEDELLRTMPGSRPYIKALSDKGWLERFSGQAPASPESLPGPELTTAQTTAVEGLIAALPEFSVSLLNGITGSGKTEVYFRIIEAALALGRQVLVLVPEIGLTPQLIARFRSRFRCQLCVLHSGLSAGERLAAWCRARSGEASIVIGTRSAVFVPLKAPGVLILDEEHDPSYKQQSGFLYHARDLAVMRGRELGVPVILGSATPSLETLHNVARGRYREFVLPARTGDSVLPAIEIQDMRAQHVEHGLTRRMIETMARHLEQGRQVLVFLNRRGFATSLVCHDCGWMAGCRHCDTRLVLHRRRHELRCHYCGYRQGVMDQCPECQGTRLRALGFGTERLEEALNQAFPDIEVIRIDRDTTRRKGALDEILGNVRDDRPQILIGTQLLAKGHDFPNVTLVVVINADQGLYGVDFRSSERMGQMILQVAGRAGRAEHAGEVVLQSYHPDHPLLTCLQGHDYAAFARSILEERRETGLPPYSNLALIRADSTQALRVQAFLEAVADQARAAPVPGVEIFGPVPAAIERRVGRHHAQLLLQSEDRAGLHRQLNGIAAALETLAARHRVHWSMDVDPIEIC